VPSKDFDGLPKSLDGASILYNGPTKSFDGASKLLAGPSKDFNGLPKAWTAHRSPQTGAYPGFCV
jgi:hypothetical protein